MSYDEGLAERIREMITLVVPPSGGLDPQSGPPQGGTMNLYTEKKMFGGLCFMVSGHMCCGIVGDTLMARVGPDQYEVCLDLPHVRKMDFTGRPMRGMLYVDPDGIAEDDALSEWLGRCLSFVHTLPAR